MWLWGRAERSDVVLPISPLLHSWKGEITKKFSPIFKNAFQVYFYSLDLMLHSLVLVYVGEFTLIPAISSQKPSTDRQSCYLHQWSSPLLKPMVNCLAGITAYSNLPHCTRG